MGMEIVLGVVASVVGMVAVATQTITTATTTTTTIIIYVLICIRTCGGNRYFATWLRTDTTTILSMQD